VLADAFALVPAAGGAPGAVRPAGSWPRPAPARLRAHALGASPRAAFAPAADERDDELSEVIGAVRSVRSAGPNLLVLKTPPGRAAAVAVAIDRAPWPEVVGTIAGDDTLLVLSSDRRHQQRIEARLGRLLKENA
jgi:Arginine repressor, C-terminal domain